MNQRPLYHYTCDHNAPAIRACLAELDEQQQHKEIGHA